MANLHKKQVNFDPGSHLSKCWIYKTQNVRKAGSLNLSPPYSLYGEAFPYKTILCVFHAAIIAQCASRVTVNFVKFIKRTHFFTGGNKIILITRQKVSRIMSACENTRRSNCWDFITTWYSHANCLFANCVLMNRRTYFLMWRTDSHLFHFQGKTLNG
jgi:hypothetical protein